MRIIMVVILGATLLFSDCAHYKVTETNFEDIMSIDAMLDSVNGKLIVRSVAPEGPAAIVGLAEGDIITAMDGKLINRHNEFARMMYSKQKGDHVLSEIIRNGKLIKIVIIPKVYKMPPTLLKIASLLNDDKVVKVAVIVGDVVNAFPDTPKDWTESTKNNLQTNEEIELLKIFGKDENFTLINGNGIMQTLDKLQINRLELGYVSDQLRVKIGEMTGATNIIEITFYRFRRGYPWTRIEDMINARLIEVESGSVLAVDQWRTY